MRSRHAALAALLLVLTSLTSILASTSSEATGWVPYHGKRPNIVLISTDDQALTDMAWMPKTRRLIGAAGVTFTHMLSPHPLCCPARAEILTGQYAQNNGVRSNKWSLHGGFHRLQTHHTIATWLQRAGYQTAFVGKYLNEYGASDGRQPGWDIWNPTIRGVYRYYNYRMYDDGHPRDYPYAYNPDLVGWKTVAYIKRFARKDQPFFIWSSQVAPHGACVPKDELSCWQPPVPPKRYARAFADVESPSVSDPSYNEADVSDKPAAITNLGLRDTAFVNEDFRDRIRSLQAVDEATAATIRALRDTGRLKNTVVAFITDNGYLLGEHRFTGKDVPYEQAVHVPLLVRGPGFPAGAVRTQTVSMVDLAPTFLDLANARADRTVDGRSIAPLAADPGRPGYDTVLIQAGPRNPGEAFFGWYFRGVRTERYTYAYYPSARFTELYDRKLDPAEMDNVAGDPDYALVQAELARRATLLEGCKGATCRPPWPAMPDPAPGADPAAWQRSS